MSVGVVRAAAAVTGVLLAAGCGSAADTQVQAVADRFSAAAGRGDGAAACALLAPSTRRELERSEQLACAEAVVALDLPEVRDVAGVERYGRQGSVVLTGPGGERDTYFLARHGTAWLVSAAGCEPQGELPYACDLEGP